MANDRSKYRADFEFMRGLLTQFFDRGSIHRMLNLIEKVKITGWEKWWQVEFTAWISGNDNIGDWVMEEKFLTDSRQKTEKNYVAIDIGFRIKGFSKKEMLFLELKQANHWKSCINKMLADAEKVYMTRKTSIDNKLLIRNFFVVGVYLTGNTLKKDIFDYIECHAEELSIDIERANIFTKTIRETPFSVTAF